MGREQSSIYLALEDYSHGRNDSNDCPKRVNDMLSQANREEGGQREGVKSDNHFQ
ncbi:hypothetical protein RND71_024150 [Anisodus tanguticus]|uniref:Uncharacterized protein n=1 Tax=Anisodus tanguticus TaxID=243964 RepID=A0AAE1VBD2_9SOLA|nr:hypothetical protein RND71_024150 [Anisodus tanguticus]